MIGIREFTRVNQTHVDSRPKAPETHQVSFGISPDCLSCDPIHSPDRVGLVQWGMFEDIDDPI